MEFQNSNKLFEDQSDSDMYKTPVKRKLNFIDYAKNKAKNEFISTLCRSINRYRYRVFSSIKASCKILSFISRINKRNSFFYFIYVETLKYILSIYK